MNVHTSNNQLTQTNKSITSSIQRMIFTDDKHFLKVDDIFRDHTLFVLVLLFSTSIFLLASDYWLTMRYLLVLLLGKCYLSCAICFFFFSAMFIDLFEKISVKIFQVTWIIRITRSFFVSKKTLQAQIIGNTSGIEMTLLGMQIKSAIWKSMK